MWPQVRKNLHVCLCFSPINEEFRTRALRFPAIVSSTVIDWFHPWPGAVAASAACGCHFVELHAQRLTGVTVCLSTNARALGPFDGHMIPADALQSVSKKFLAQIKDLGSTAVREAVERFMPYAFESMCIDSW